MKNLILLFAAAMAVVSCQKDNVSDIDPMSIEETVSLEQMDALEYSLKEPASSSKATSASEDAFLSGAISKAGWKNPWWIQQKLDGYGLHYGNSNPLNQFTQLDKDAWYRQGSYLMDDPVLGKYIVVLNNTDERVTIIDRSHKSTDFADGHWAEKWSSANHFLIGQTFTSGTIQENVQDFMSLTLVGDGQVEPTTIRKDAFDGTVSDVNIEVYYHDIDIVSWMRHLKVEGDYDYVPHPSLSRIRFLQNTGIRLENTISEISTAFSDVYLLSEADASGRDWSSDDKIKSGILLLPHLSNSYPELELTDYGYNELAEGESMYIGVHTVRKGRNQGFTTFKITK